MRSIRNHIPIRLHMPYWPEVINLVEGLGADPDALRELYISAAGDGDLSVETLERHPDIDVRTTRTYTLRTEES